MVVVSIFHVTGSAETTSAVHKGILLGGVGAHTLFNTYAISIDPDVRLPNYDIY